MSHKKRAQEDVDTQKRKKPRLSEKGSSVAEKPVPSVLRNDEVDFPRGGGTSFTPVEYKQIRAEAIKELKDEVFKDSDASKKKQKGKDKKNKSSVAGSGKQTPQGNTGKVVTSRVEHLNYKRIAEGMKILCQVVAVYPLALIVSLPDQLLGHIPITQISSQLTETLEEAEDEDDSEDVVNGAEDEEGDEEDGKRKKGPPDLMELFQPGQYLRAVVTALKPPGTTEGRSFSYARDELEKTSRRVELSLIPSQVNSGVVKADLRRGFALSAAVKSVEDHGYVLDLGSLADMSGFLPFKKAEHEKNRPVGALLNVTVDKMGEDGRTCFFNASTQLTKISLLKEISNISSLLPGTLVQALVTAVGPSGLNVQILGSFAGSIDLYHLPQGKVSKLESGKTINARVLYEIAGTSPPEFALSITEHVVALEPKSLSEGRGTVEDSFPIGTHLQSVKVKRVESERGLIVEVQEGVDGMVHISHVSDEHVPSLPTSSGKWKVDTVHQARVVGYHPFDGILQLSFRPSVLTQKFLRVDDVHVGELVKGTVRKLTDTALFVRINGNVDGMIWPMHYADIMLKHPQKRFKIGVAVKCRVLAVDPSRKRILLTAKKSLVESDLPLITSLDTAKCDLIAIGVVFKVVDKGLIVEFYNSIRGFIPTREASETPVANLSESFPLGKPVKVRIIKVDQTNSRIIASIRRLMDAPGEDNGSVKDIEIGQAVSGVVSEVVGENVRLSLHPHNARALLSLKNIANSRETTVDQLRTTIGKGEELKDLVVVSRNIEKGFVLVANKPKPKAQTSRQAPMDIKTITVGMTVTGRVQNHSRNGTVIKFPGRVTGLLHPTDASDNYDEGTAFPPVDTIITAIVVAVNASKRQLTLSTRPSRLKETSSGVVDSELSNIEDVKVDAKVRGFIKSITDHGLFVSIGRDLDARVQIKELYDEYVKDWKKGFTEQKRVEGRIISVDPAKKQIEMTFRTTPSRTKLSFFDLQVGQKVNGVVKKVTDFGIFVTIGDSKLSGLCHKSEVADNKQSDVALALRNFREGDPVRAIILKLTTEGTRISLGLKPSYFEDEEMESADDIQKVVESTELPGEDLTMDVVEESAKDSDEDPDDGMSVNEQTLLQSQPSTTVPSQRPSTSLVPALSLQGGFQWSGQPDVGSDNEDSSSEEDPDARPEQRKKKKKKGIEYDVTGEMHTRVPQSASDFERQLLGSPNSSYLWIHYMSFQLQLSEVDKAREIGRRALQAINLREEQEKLNVWIALLNLENTFGSEETLDKSFKEAARMCDSKTIHLRLAAIFAQSEKHDKAEAQFQRTCKKFSQSSKVWTLFGEHHFRRGNFEEARKLLQRSLLSLEKLKHLKTISKFAQMEYKLGDPERGKTIFEGIVDSQPKRFDLWSVYMDMEAGQKDIQSLRNIFERVLSIKMTSHKAKAFFKKWLSLEQRIGDEDGERTVKEKAIEWTQRTVGSQS